MKNPIAFLRLIALLTVLIPAGARGDDTVIELRFENRSFTPQTITVPANQSLILRITNASKEAIEFESFELNRERVVPPGSSITVYLPSLNPGTYHFFDDLHHDVGQGTLTAK